MTDLALKSNSPDIPDKLYFRIGEVSGLLGVEPYVLRYWESEFPSLSPKKSGTGHRLYRRKDVELLLRIKHLLYEKRYTIEGARQTLQKEGKKHTPKTNHRGQGSLFADDPLPDIRKELVAILDILK
ncbi:MAG TPA: MerR family transcriptional regulator [Bryobacteraceae bacterium]|nr:MerR family transcriptional regulator [Bryobacteraceae bacterium]